MRRARPYRGENPEPARMFMESLTSGPELENSQDPKQHFATVNYCIAKGLFDHAVGEREEVKAAEYRQAAMLCSDSILSM